MNINTKLDGIIAVSLSRRNLEGLIRQLDEKKKGDPAQLMRKTDAGLILLIAEEDNVHYNSPEREERARGEAGWSGPGDPCRSVVAS